MLPASNRGAGECMGFPDICLTPAAPAPIPTPYPNIGMNAMAAPFSPTVMLSMVPALNQGSMIPMTMGDELGSASPIKGPARYTMGNPIVKVNALPAINLTCPTTGNNMNDALGAVLVPSVTNVFFTSTVAGAPTRGALERGAVLALAAAVEGARADVDARDDEAAIVRPGVFGFATSTEIANAIGGHARAVVIDLRGHPGGDLDAAVAFAADFLHEDAIVARRVDADGDEELLRALGPALHTMPVVVLVDGDTASAAEVVAAALADHGRALLVGERTRGKGTAERVVARFDAPGAAYATVARVRSPSGAEIDGAGVAPDVEVRGAPIDDSAIEAIAGATSAAIARAVARAWTARSPER